MKSEFDKMEQQASDLADLALEAKHAIQDLKMMQNLYMRGQVTYDQIKEAGAPLVSIYNHYAKALAKARKMPYKPISLGYFLR